MSEVGEAATFDVTLRTRPSAPVDVEVRSEAPAEGLVIAPGYAVPAPSREVTFTPEDWDVPRSIAIHATDDHVDEGDVAYTITVRVLFSADPDYAAAPAIAVRVTNVDDDAPALVVSLHALATAEGGAPATFAVRLATVPSDTVYVEVAGGDASEGLLAPSIATAGDSHAGCWYAGATLNLVFSRSDWYRPQPVDVCPQDDLDPDGDHTYAITIRSSFYALEYAALAPEVVIVTNADDETGFRVVAPPQLVTSEGGTAATFTVVLNAQPSSDVLVPVTSGNPAEGLVASGGAAPAASVTLVFTPENFGTPQVVTVIGQDDAPASPAIDDDVTYLVTIGPSASADRVFSGRAAQIEVLNLDDDAPVVVVVPAGALVTSEGGTTAAFEVSLGQAPATDVTLPVTSCDPGEGLVAIGYGSTPEPSVRVTFTPLDWQTPRTIVVFGQRDAIVDGDRTYPVQVGPADGDRKYAGLPAQSLTFTNLDIGASFTSVDVPKGIPDVSIVDSVLTVASGPAELTSVSVFVTLKHTWDGDLVLTVVAPSGSAVTLAWHCGGSGDDFTGTTFDDGATTLIGAGFAPFAGSYSPTAPLSALAGEDANGVWTLRIQDDAGGDAGTLLSWGVTVR